jgi:hypothetical protein
MTDEPITPPAPLAGGQIAQARATWLSHGYPAEQFDAAVASDNASPTPTSPPPVEVPVLMNAINLGAENEQQMASMVATSRQFGMSDRDAMKFAAGPVTVTPEVRGIYEALKTRVMADKAWVARYLDGGQAERALMWEINARLIANVVPGGKGP